MRKRLRWLGGMLSLAALAASSPAAALPPIDPEQLLCNSPYIFVGRVLSVVNKDCRLARAAAQCSSARKNELQLEILMTRILGIRPSMVTAPAAALRVGQTIRPTATALAAPYRMEKHDGVGGLAFTAPYEAILPDETLKAAYLDQAFLFSGGAQFVHTWPLDKIGWAQETMTRFSRSSDASRCQTPL